MLQKILHKKWMAVSLLIGNILLIAIAVSHPMYQAASRNRMLTDEFTNYMKDNNAYPMLIDVEGLIRKHAGKSDTERIRNFANTVAEQFGIGDVLKVCVRNLVASAGTPTSLYDRASSDDETPVDYTQNSEAQFSPLSFGGMWVKTLAANGSPFKTSSASC